MKIIKKKRREASFDECRSGNKNSYNNHQKIRCYTNFWLFGPAVLGYPGSRCISYTFPFRAVWQPVFSFVITNHFLAPAYIGNPKKSRSVRPSVILGLAGQAHWRKETPTMGRTDCQLRRILISYFAFCQSEQHLYYPFCWSPTVLGLEPLVSWMITQSIQKR